MDVYKTVLCVSSKKVKKYKMCLLFCQLHSITKEKSRIRQTPNLLTDADSSTDIFVFDGVKKRADSNFFGKIHRFRKIAVTLVNMRCLMS